MATATLDAEAIIGEMTARIVAGFHPLRVVLFGSRARGDHRPDSDVDLLVVMPDPLDGHGRRSLAIEMAVALADLGLPKDVIVTSPAEIARRGDLIGSVLRPALREGVTLYGYETRPADLRAHGFPA